VHTEFIYKCSIENVPLVVFLAAGFLAAGFLAELALFLAGAWHLFEKWHEQRVKKKMLALKISTASVVCCATAAALVAAC
jgi:hypothetical protein